MNACGVVIGHWSLVIGEIRCDVLRKFGIACRNVIGHWSLVIGKKALQSNANQNYSLFTIHYSLSGPRPEPLFTIHHSPSGQRPEPLFTFHSSLFTHNALQRSAL
jgi:hypothetical protein